MLIVEIGGGGREAVIRSYKQTATCGRSHRCFARVEFPKMTFYRCSPSVRRFVNEIFKERIKSNIGQEIITIVLTPEEKVYVDMVLVGARWSAVMREYLRTKG